MHQQTQVEVGPARRIAYTQYACAHVRRFRPYAFRLCTLHEGSHSSCSTCSHHGACSGYIFRLMHGEAAQPGYFHPRAANGGEHKASVSTCQGHLCCWR